jgi:hypothetical protein
LSAHDWHLFDEDVRRAVSVLKAAFHKSREMFVDEASDLNSESWHRPELPVGLEAARILEL